MKSSEISQKGMRSRPWKFSATRYTIPWIACNLTAIFIKGMDIGVTTLGIRNGSWPSWPAECQRLTEQIQRRNQLEEVWGKIFTDKAPLAPSGSSTSACKRRGHFETCAWKATSRAASVVMWTRLGFGNGEECEGDGNERERKRTVTINMTVGGRMEAIGSRDFRRCR